MHFDEERIQRLLHDELPEDLEADVRGHLASCSRCRDRVAEAAREEEEVYALLGLLDHPPTPVEAGTVIARARTHRLARMRWAAAILLGLGAAGAAYAAPGSPVPGWVQTLVTWAAGGPETPDARSTGRQEPEPDIAGIAVAPGENLIIIFRSAEGGGEARVSLSDGEEVVVRVLRGAATFTSDVDRLEIEARGASPYFEIQIPRSAPRVEIRTGDERIFLKEGARVTTAMRSDSREIYRLPLAPPEP